MDSDSPALTIVHGSDLHFGQPHRPTVAEAFLDSIRVAAPDLIVLSGDFTQRAKAREYAQAREYLDRMPDVPTVVTPGNHDVPLYRVVERILTPYRNYRAHIREELNTVTRLRGLTVVSLNSAAPRRAIVNGRIEPWQLDFARKAFSETPRGDVKAVVAHHHLSPAPDYGGGRPLPRAREILDALEGMGVELVMGGHLHRAYIGDSLDVYPGADRDRGVVIVQSGTTTSGRGRAREREKNTFNLVRLTPAHLEVTHYMYFGQPAGFAPLSVHLFPRSPRLWLDRGALRSEVPAGGVGREGEQNLP